MRDAGSDGSGLIALGAFATLFGTLYEIVAVIVVGLALGVVGALMACCGRKGGRR